MNIVNRETLNERAKHLPFHNLNGIKFILVEIVGTKAELTIHFFTDDGLSDLKNHPNNFLSFSGGRKILSNEPDEPIKIESVSGNSADKILTFVVTLIGDYSTYTLHVNHGDFDNHPCFSIINFKFRPGCFNVDCSPDWEPASPLPSEPIIDYLAKDYDSFKHIMISALKERNSDWNSTSEADFDQVILESFSAISDELSDYQDRVMNEAFLASSRKRVSLARHARMMNYYIHQGNQSDTFLAVIVKSDLTLDKEFFVWAGDDELNESSIIFTRKPSLHTSDTLPNPIFKIALNTIKLYTWGNTITTLPINSTFADLEFSNPHIISNLINKKVVSHFLIQENLVNSITNEIKKTKSKRQLLRLLKAEVISDPLLSNEFLRVWWDDRDKLRSDFHFEETLSSIDSPTRRITNFYGNLVKVFQGQVDEVSFKDNEQLLVGPKDFHYDRIDIGKLKASCKLPEPLAYQNTIPGGEYLTKSVLNVTINSSTGIKTWSERPNLIHSESDDLHYVVETDEENNSIIKFGDGINGHELPSSATVICEYQVGGGGTTGNLGSDAITNFQYTDVESCWNPFDVTNGRDPESVEVIKRNVPEFYKHKQERAITIYDYIDQVNEIDGVSKAWATYRWTGSWRTVQVTVDPIGSHRISNELYQRITSRLNTIKLIGEDFEVRPAKYIPLEINVKVCVKSQFWPEDVRHFLEQEFSDGYTANGKMAFFHPDRWTFGQKVFPSQIISVAESIHGVDHVADVSIKKWNDPTSIVDSTVEIAPDEIIQVRNDHNHQELGVINFEIIGGRT